MQVTEAEQIVIGTILCYSEAIFQIGRELRPDHFEHPTHQTIYAACLDLIDADEPCSPMAVMHKLKRSSADTDFASYLARLAATGSAIADVAGMATLIMSAATKRMLVQAAHRVIADAEKAETSGLISIMSDAIEGGLKGDFVKAIHNDAYVAERIAEGLKVKREIYGTGIAKLDKYLKGGIHAGRVYCMAAPSGAGKTQLAVTLSYALTQQDVPHLFVCAEMGEEEIHQRKIARQMGCSTDVFYDTDLQDAAFWGSFGAVASKQKKLCHYLSDPFITLERLKNATLSAIVRQRVKVLIVDYFQLIGGAGRNASMHEHYTQVAQWLAALAKDKGIAVFYTLQTNEDGNVLGGGAAKRSCDVLLFGERPNDDEQGLFLYATKMRYGKLFRIGTKREPELQVSEYGTHIEEI